MQLLRVYFWDVYTVYINDPQAEKSLKFTRKDEYVYQFVRLIIEDHSPDKDVAYFAQKLGISPKRLTNLIRSISGQSAREWIVYYTILEIKSLLRESSLDLNQIREILLIGLWVLSDQTQAAGCFIYSFLLCTNTDTYIVQIIFIGTIHFTFIFIISSGLLGNSGKVNQYQIFNF